MTDEMFDDIIREKLQGYAAPVSEDMWSRIMAEKKKDKPLFPWWKLAGVTGLMICVAAVFGWLGPFGNREIAMGSSISTTGTSMPGGNGTGSTFQQSGAGLPLADGKMNAAKHAGDNALSLTSAERDRLVVTQKAADPAVSTPNSSRDNQTPASSITHRNNKVSINRATLQGDNSVQTAFAQQTNNTTTEHESMSDNRRFVPHLLAFHERTMLNAGAVPASLNQLKAARFSSVDCPSDRRTGNHAFYVEFFGSPDMAFKDMTYKSSRGTGYLNRKDSTTSRMLSYTFGMRFTKEMGQNLLFKTGVQFSQINEKFSYRNENERYTTTVVTIRSITNTDGSTTTVRDTAIVEHVGYRVKTTYNRYRSVDVPVLLGYNFSGEGWNASITGGAVFNLSSSQQGDFLDTSYTPVSFAKSGPAVFKTKLGVSLYGGISLAKSVTERMEVFAEPYLRYSLSDRTTASSPFNARFHTAGILLGVRFKLSRPEATK